MYCAEAVTVTKRLLEVVEKGFSVSVSELPSGVMS